MARDGGPKARLVSKFQYLRLSSILLGIFSIRQNLLMLMYLAVILLIAKLAARISNLRGLKLVLTLREAIRDELKDRRISQCTKPG